MSTVNRTINTTTTTTATTKPQQQLGEKRARSVKEQALPCPRCNSTNTKFCYYNNYSLTQPRYFCKTCRRYWTEGGSLRNVPVGGGSRKNKKHSSSSSTSTSNPATKINHNINVQPPPLLPISSGMMMKPYDDIINNGGLYAMDLLRSTGITARGLSPLVHMSMAPESTGAIYGSGFGLNEFKFNLDGNGTNGNVMQEGGGRLLFPFGDLNQVSMKSSTENVNGQENRLQGGDPSMWGGANLGGNGGSW